MISETATFRIKEGHESEFEQAVARAVPLFQQASGALGLRLDRTVEDPSEYVLTVGWTTLEAHTEQFRTSAAFTRWRSLIGEHLAADPQVRHTVHVTTGF